MRLRVFVRCVYSVGCACSICVCGLWCFHVFVCDMWLLLGTWSWYVELTQFCFCGLRSVIYSSSQFVICGLCGCERLSVLCMVVWCFHALVRVVWLLLGAWSWWVVLIPFFGGSVVCGSFLICNLWRGCCVCGVVWLCHGTVWCGVVLTCLCMCRGAAAAWRWVMVCGVRS